MKESGDLKIINQFLQGNREIEKKLYDVLNKIIHCIIHKMESKGCYFVDKDNTVADIIYKILLADNHRILKNYKGKSKLTTYLWPIVKNKIIDTIRKENRKSSKIFYQELPEYIHNQNISQTGTMESIIEEHIASEPPLERSIKIAKWKDNLSYREIIDKINKNFPEKAPFTYQYIAYILHTNRKKLQKKLKNYRV